MITESSFSNYVNGVCIILIGVGIGIFTWWDMKTFRQTERQRPEPAAESITAPARGSTWSHYNGVLYHVLYVANEHSTNSRYPRTVVYEGANGHVWARPLADWHRSMTEVL